MHYLNILKALKGRSIEQIEYSAPGRNCDIAISSNEFPIVWDFFDNDKIVLVVTKREMTVPKNGINQRVTIYLFHWIPVERIVALRTLLDIEIDGKSNLTRTQEFPMYFSQHKGWEVVNDAVMYHVERRLFEMGLREHAPAKPGADFKASEKPVPDSGSQDPVSGETLVVAPTEPKEAASALS